MSTSPDVSQDVQFEILEQLSSIREHLSKVRTYTGWILALLLIPSVLSLLTVFIFIFNVGVGHSN